MKAPEGEFRAEAMRRLLIAALPEETSLFGAVPKAQWVYFPPSQASSGAS